MVKDIPLGKTAHEAWDYSKGVIKVWLLVAIGAIIAGVLLGFPLLITVGKVILIASAIVFVLVLLVVGIVVWHLAQK